MSLDDAARTIPGGNADTIDLVCYLREGWTVNIRPAPTQRNWMDETPDKYAYRCLPMDVANSAGWELLLPSGFTACWFGGPSASDIVIKLDLDMPHYAAPISTFGRGILTFHVNGLFRTSPGWNLHVGGPPNRPKDGIAALTGLVETDWSPYTFTMNWQFTRANHWLRFDVGEAFCFIQPQPRGLLDRIRPRFASITDMPHLDSQNERWSESRDAFLRTTRATPPERVSDQWQKPYYRGQDMDGKQGVADHRLPGKLHPFVPIRSKEGS